MRKHYPLDPTTGAENAALLPWSDGVPQTGTFGSYPPQALVTDTEAEILAALDAAGLPRTGADLTQLAQAMSIGLYLGTFGGTANALTAMLNSAFPLLLPGMVFHGYVGPNPNTGAVTLAIGGFNTSAGTQPVVCRDGLSALQAGDLPKGALVSFRWDGTAFRHAGMARSDVQSQVSNSNANTLTYGGRNVSFGTPTNAGAASWTVPAGVYVIHVRLWGAGGGGGGSYGVNSAGAGGSGGGYAEGVFAVTPGQVIPITIGLGGFGGTGTSGGGGSGSAGGTTSFGSLLSATGGGYGGGAVNGIASFIGTPGIGIGGFRQVAGSNGGSGFPINGGTLSGVGGPAYTTPGAGANTGTNGTPGTFPGGGAAGASSASNTGLTGGTGANGFISIDF